MRVGQSDCCLFGLSGKLNIGRDSCRSCETTGWADVRCGASSYRNDPPRAASSSREGKEIVLSEFAFRARRSQLREARVQVGNALGAEGIDSDHATAVVAVVNELIAAARECEVTTPVKVNVATYPLLTSVRVHCDRNVELREQAVRHSGAPDSALRGRVGRRRRDDGTVDLWAEIA